MEIKQWKKSCTVTCDNRSFDGIAHVVEVQYDARFLPWFAAIQFADQNAISLSNEIEVKFESGRKAIGRVTSRYSDGFAAYLEGEMETPALQIYVVGQSALVSLTMGTGERKHFFE